MQRYENCDSLVFLPHTFVRRKPGQPVPRAFPRTTICKEAGNRKVPDFCILDASKRVSLLLVLELQMLNVDGFLHLHSLLC